MQLSRLFNQTAVYWAPSSQDGYGTFSFDAGVEITCRWENQKEYFIDENGETKLSSAIILTTTAVVRGGYLFLGDLDDLDSAAEEDPTQENESWLIQAVGTTPNVAADLDVVEATL